MRTPDGARKQESLRSNPAARDVLVCHDLLLGIIQKHGVFHQDNGQNPSKSTLVNISLQHGWPDIYRVPILSPKINRSNGTSMDPEPGDQVVVAFLNGNFSLPVVIGFLPPPGNGLQQESADSPLHHTHWQGSDYKLEKDGTRRSAVAKDDILNVAGDRTEAITGTRQVTVGEDDTLEVTGDGTIIVHGGLTVHVIGAADITVDGNATVTTPTATVVASTKVQMTTPLVECSQDMKINGKLDVVGNIKSTEGEVGDKVRNMSGDRSIYNGHKHIETGSITYPPNNKQ